MIPDNVTLVVKAPNQRIDDQNIECQSSWTVKQLKGHLSEVYPSKPRTEEQKIIYSGQLLDDNAVLKDILRTYESQIVHTMHLVCAPSRRESMTMPSSTDGIRRRTVETQPEPTAEPPRAETRQNDQNHTVEMQNYLSSFVNYGRVPPYPNYNMGEGYLPVPNDPAQLANHILMMQQAYLQYMQQYANMWQAAGAPPPTAPPPAQAPPPAPEAPPVADDPDDALAPRDWLDHLYAASRLAILFSLVYLYGSPARLLLVLLLAAAGYLHQIGFFRDLHVNPQNAQPQAANPQPQGANPQPQGANRQPQEANAQPQGADPQPQGANPQPQGANPQPQGANPQPPSEAATRADTQQSLLAVTWMIFTSFFASLIPDTN